jgi:hypothetical protein
VVEGTDRTLPVFFAAMLVAGRVAEAAADFVAVFALVPVAADFAAEADFAAAAPAPEVFAPVAPEVLACAVDFEVVVFEAAVREWPEGGALPGVAPGFLLFAATRRRVTASSSMVLRFDLTRNPSSLSLASASDALRFSSLAISPTRTFAT